MIVLDIGGVVQVYDANHEQIAERQFDKVDAAHDWIERYQLENARVSYATYRPHAYNFYTRGD
jgi:hypothetical protein